MYLNSQVQLELKPGKLPSNDYAFNNILYTSRQDYQVLKQACGGQEPVFVKAKNFVLKLGQLDELVEGSYGASSL